MSVVLIYSSYPGAKAQSWPRCGASCLAGSSWACPQYLDQSAVLSDLVVFCCPIILLETIQFENGGKYSLSNS